MRNRFMDMFGLSAPILQAPIAGSDPPRLAIEVGRGGGMGSLALTWDERETGLASVAEVKREGTPFFLNFVLRFGSERLRWYAGCGMPAVTLSWGIDDGVIEFLKNRGTRVGVQVATAGGAAKAIASGADFIIAQGIEAGGHVQSTTPLKVLLREVLAVSGEVPVVAAGGIASASDIAEAIKAGAQAVMMGTRFVASAESTAHPLYKAALVTAKAEDSVYTNCFDIGWSYAMHRVLRNTTVEAWEAAGCPASPARPGEDEVVMRTPSRDIRRYDFEQPAEDAGGDVMAGCLYAGTSVGAITSVLPARRIVEDLWSEAQRLL